MNQFFIQLVTFLSISFVVIFISAAITFKLKKKSVVKFFAENNGALFSAILAITVVSVLALFIFLIPNNANANIISDGSWSNDAGVYLGLDYTKDHSPQCIGDSFDNRGTSNLGAWWNIWQSKDENLRISARYTHHSCYLGEDDNTYDAIGVQVEWELWKRK